MAKKYKGYKGAGMNQKKMANYKIGRAVRECLILYLANGCKVPKKGCE